MFVSTKERNHKHTFCDQCGKSFNTLHNLKAHILIHFKNKKVPCDYCGKVFAQGSVLTRHLQEHSASRASSSASSTMESFTLAFDDKLIDLVHLNAMLYDKTRNDYLNKTMKENAWKSISTELGKSVADCKSRWKNIRDSYRKNKKKSSSDGPKRKSKYNEEKLKFLDGRFVARSTKIANMLMTSQVDGDNNKEEADASQTETTPGSPNGSVANDKHLKRTRNETIVPSAKKSVIEKVGRGRDDRRRVSENVVQKSRQASKTPTHTFFESMAETVVNFPPHLIAEARIRVCEIINNLEIRALNEASGVGDTQSNCRLPKPVCVNNPQNHTDATSESELHGFISINY